MWGTWGAGNMRCGGMSLYKKKKQTKTKKKKRGEGKKTPKRLEMHFKRLHQLLGGIACHAGGSESPIMSQTIRAPLGGGT